MTTPDFVFRHKLSQPLMTALTDLAKSKEAQWWRDILDREDVIFAMRDDCLDIYYRGGVIFRVFLSGTNVVGKTHFKYLIRQKQAYVEIASDNRFNFDPRDFFWDSYEDSATLDEMIRAANSFAGPEKKGVHALVQNNRHNVIDLEIALPRDIGPRLQDDTKADDLNVLEDASDDASSTNPTNLPQKANINFFERIDIAALEPRGDEIFVVFYEAKHFGNRELRAAPNRTPSVATQIGRYQKLIKAHSAEISESYQEACKAFVLFDQMRMELRVGNKESAMKLRNGSPILEVANGKPIHVDPNPRLIIFGFDQDQKMGYLWGRHRERLEEEFELRVYAFGNPASARIGNWR